LGEAEDEAILDVEIFAGEEADAVKPAPDPIESQVSENHYIAWAGLDHDAIGPANQD
jgi:hypothetical protein